MFAAACSGSPASPTSPLAMSGSTSQQGGASGGKVDVCHKSGSGFHMINVSSNALQAHLAHGDGVPNGAVPGSSTQIFSATCEVLTLQKHTLTLVSGVGGGVGSLDSSVTYTKALGGSGSAIILNTHPAYASLSGARWVNWGMITTWPNYGFGLPHTGNDITYTTAFTLPAGAVNPSLSGTFYADNRGSAFLNGAPIGAHTAAPFQYGFNTPASVSATSGFAAGANTLSFTVEDFGGVAGVAFVVTVTYFAP